jgi:hypothetical protein
MNLNDLHRRLLPDVLETGNALPQPRETGEMLPGNV